VKAMAHKDNAKTKIGAVNLLNMSSLFEECAIDNNQFKVN